MYDSIMTRLMNGMPITEEEIRIIRNYADYIIYNQYIPPYDVYNVRKIISICNIIYNNIPNMLSPLDDEQYDRLIVLCRRQGIQYEVGAKFAEGILDFDGTPVQDYSMKDVLTIVPNKDDMIYFDPLTKNKPPIKEDYIIEPFDSYKEYKKIRSVPHSYNLCGTLDKCKFVLNADASAVGLANDMSISIFERDFLAKHIRQHIVDPNNITLIASLKYDGVSVEATVRGNQIISACTRGELSTNTATDLTPILEGLTFARANEVDPNEEFGVKFEFVLTKRNMDRIRMIHDKDYVNLRNAVIGLLGRLDSRQFRDYFTPIPLESTVSISTKCVYANNYPRILELMFLNQYYTKNIDMRFTIIQGNYVEVLYKLKKLVEEADMLRDYSEFQYDGIVVEYADPYIREVLGKTNSIPNYAIAIKFPPMRKTSTFTHYTYSVGQTGVITPKAHFLPVEFMGQIHDKTTVHSLKRFNELHLRPGDKVELTLSNDVIVYLTKAQYQTENTNEYEQFPTHCPSCGSQLRLSSTGDSAYCPNFMCKERCISRLSNMLSKLNLKGFSTETIRALKVSRLKELLDMDVSIMKQTLGDVRGQQLRDALDSLSSTAYPDYILLASLGFTNVGPITWQTIMSYLNIDQIINGNDKDLSVMRSLQSIGDKTYYTILEERQYFKDELCIISKGIPYISSKSNSNKGQVRFTGVRDEALANMFRSKGYEVSEGSVSSKCAILVVPYTGYNSTKVDKAMELRNKTNSDIPKIVTLQEAYELVN